MLPRRFRERIAGLPRRARERIAGLPRRAGELVVRGGHALDTARTAMAYFRLVLSALAGALRAAPLSAPIWRHETLCVRFDAPRFCPAPWGRPFHGALAQTVMAGLPSGAGRCPRLDGELQEAGGGMGVLWGRQLGGGGCAHVVVFVPGLDSNVRGPQARLFCDMAGRLGMAFAALDRGNTYRAFGDTAGLREAVAALAAGFPDGARICLVGASAGANQVVRYASEPGLHPSVACAVSLGNGLDLPASMRALERRGALSRVVASVFKRTVRSARGDLLGRGVGAAALSESLRSSSLPGVDWPLALALGCPEAGSSMEAYYSARGSADELRRVAVPTLTLLSADDPLHPPCAVGCALRAAYSNPLCSVAITPGGGHLGWFQGGGRPRWHVSATEAFLRSHLPPSGVGGG